MDLTPEQVDAAIHALGGIFGGSFVLLVGQWRLRVYKVIKVVDGDTVHLKRFPWEVFFDHEKREYESVRLYGIDTPERGEKGYQEATEALKRATLGKNVRVTWHGRGKYGRSLATLYRFGWNLNKWMLRKGLAREYV